MFAHRSLSLYGGHTDEINCIVFSRDFEILLTASITGCIRLWNTVFQSLTIKIQEQTGLIRALAISNDDRHFASTASDTRTRLYETRTGALLFTLTGHTHASDCLHFSSNSQLLASGAWDCRTILWNVLTGEQMYNFHHHTSAVQSIAFHPSMNVMATGSHDHLVFLYNLDQPLPSKPVLLRGHFGNVRALDFSRLPYLASAGWDKIVVIWHLDTARIRHRLFGHTGWIQAVSFRDDDGSILASVDDDSIRVWNIFSGSCLHLLEIVSDLSCSVRFLPNNAGIVVGSAVYEILIDQSMSRRKRSRVKRVRQPVTEETIMMPQLLQQHVPSKRLSRRDTTTALPSLKPRPHTQHSMRQQRIRFE